MVMIYVRRKGRAQDLDRRRSSECYPVSATATLQDLTGEAGQMIVEFTACYIELGIAMAIAARR